MKRSVIRINKTNRNKNKTMKEQKLTSEHFKRMFESIQTVSMSIFSWFKNRREMKYEVE